MESVGGLQRGQLERPLPGLSEAMGCGVVNTRDKSRSFQITALGPPSGRSPRGAFPGVWGPFRCSGRRCDYFCQEEGTPPHFCPQSPGVPRSPVGKDSEMPFKGNPSLSREVGGGAASPAGVRVLFTWEEPEPPTPPPHFAESRCQVCLLKGSFAVSDQTTVSVSPRLD